MTKNENGADEMDERSETAIEKAIYLSLSVQFGDQNI